MEQFIKDHRKLQNIYLELLQTQIDREKQHRDALQALRKAVELNREITLRHLQEPNEIEKNENKK